MAAMLDRHASRAIAPAVGALARALHARGASANALTFSALAIGWAAAAAIAWHWFWLGLALILISRSLDALDGAVARLSAPTDRGGFLDIALDMLFYASIPLAFAWADPSRNALAAATLLAAFIGTGTSFLAYAVMVEKRGGAVTPSKSFHFLGGLTEATETLLFFAAMCLWPQHFGLLAYVFACLCGVTIATRIAAGWRDFN
jgi:phosphatidylglycerophosphate synthase